VLAGLRFDPLVGGDHQQYQVDATYARKHVAHEPLVARDIDEAQTKRLSAGR
jgi:hypothetical protein